MASIKRWGVFAGGAVAGLILTLSGLGLGTFVVLPELSAGFPEGYVPDTLTPLLLRFLVGLALVWTYVGFRPRFGAGRRAILAAVTVTWTLSTATFLSAVAILGVLSPLTNALVVVSMLIELLIAGFAGAAVYRRHAARSTRRRGRSLDELR
jgi:uncharacterized membrane protein